MSRESRAMSSMSRPRKQQLWAVGGAVLQRTWISTAGAVRRRPCLGLGSCFVVLETEVLEAEMVVEGTAIVTCGFSKVFKSFTNRIRELYKSYL